MFRLALLILILAALVIFALQNLLPVMPLVFLGMQTQALPLAVWVVGAIAAGAVTTLVLAVLIRLAGARTGSRSRRPPRRASGRSSNSAMGDRPWTPPPWTGDRNATQPVEDRDRGTSARQSGRATDRVDDWEQPRQSFEAWDNWDDSRSPVDAPRRASPAARTVIQDASYTDVTEPAAAYPPSFYREPADTRQSYRAEEPDEFRDQYQPPDSEGDREEWDDWEEEELRPPAPPPARSPAASVEPEPPPRTIVEIQREPQGGYQTGSVFSYTYRSSDPSSQQPEPPGSEPELGPDLEPSPEPEDIADEVADELANLARAQAEEPSTTSSTSSRSIYDAEFRVIIPPYSPPPDPSVSPEPPVVEPIVEPELTVEPDLTGYPQDSDDWDEDDIDDFLPDPPRRAQPPREPSGPSRTPPDSLEREVWDDWDDEEEPDDQPPPPSTSPEGNPPLRLG